MTDTPPDPQPLTAEEIAHLRTFVADDNDNKPTHVLWRHDVARLLATLDARPSGDEALRPWSPDLDECPNCGYSDPDWGLRAAAPPSPDVAVIRAQRRSHRRADIEAKVAAILFGAVDDETFDRVIAVLREEPHA